MSRSYNKKETPTAEITAVGNETDVVALTWKLAEPICFVEGMELIHVEYQRESGGRILRLYVDRDGGVKLDDCAAVSRQLSDLLDIKLDEDFPYTLEISSPGINRPVSRRTDFEKLSGERIKIKTAAPINGQKKFKGTLRGMIDDNIQIEAGEKTISIPFQDIKKARLVNYNGDDKCL